MYIMWIDIFIYMFYISTSYPLQLIPKSRCARSCRNSTRSGTCCHSVCLCATESTNQGRPSGHLLQFAIEHGHRNSDWSVVWNMFFSYIYIYIHIYIWNRTLNWLVILQPPWSMVLYHVISIIEHGYPLVMTGSLGNGKWPSQNSELFN